MTVRGKVGNLRVSSACVRLCAIQDKFHMTRLFVCTAGKRKFDGGHQNQGESKRRFQSNWGNQPLAQQPLGNAYGLASVNGGSGGGGGGDIGFGSRTAALGGVSSDDHEWYQDSYQSWS